MRGLDNWENEAAIAVSLAIVVHTAYHLGEIRQALCTMPGLYQRSMDRYAATQLKKKDGRGSQGRFSLNK